MKAFFHRTCMMPGGMAECVKSYWDLAIINLKNLGGNNMADKNQKPKAEEKKKPKEDKVKKEKKKYS